MARGMTLRGFCASPTVTPTSSIPRYAKTAVVKQDQNAMNCAAGTLTPWTSAYGLNAPGLFQ